MNATLARGALVAAALAMGPTSASAQLFNNPVYVSPSHGTGFSLNGEYARGFDDNKDINFVGARAMLGLGPVTAQAGAGGVLFGGGSTADNEITFGGALALNILDLPLVPVSVNVQAGAGYTKFGAGVFSTKQLDVPIAVGVSINVPAPILDVEPWIAPRLHVMRLSNGASATEVGYGVSAGLNVTLPTGVGFHVAGDYLKVSGFQVRSLVLGAGLHFRIAIPGLVPGGIVK